MNAQDIKEYGLSVGFTKIGITSADDFGEYVAEVTSRGDKYEVLNYTSSNPVKGAVPRDFMPEAKSIIVLAWDYFQQDFPANLKAIMGKAYLARGYNPIPGSMPHSRLNLMIKYLEDGGCQVDPNVGVPIRWAAARAGVSTFGRNNFAYVDGVGSYVLLYALVVDKEFALDEPTLACKCPPNCHVCIDACPTKAIYAPFKLDPRRCISFNNWMACDGLGSITSFIPHELREDIGCHIHGCDVCQDVCPRNQKKLKEAKPMDKFVEAIAPDITLPKILRMDEEFYAKRVHPIMYNYIKDMRYFKRNAIIALGNSGEEAYVPELVEVFASPDGMLRECAAWALSKIGGVAAIKALERQSKLETDSRARQTIDEAMEKLRSQVA